METTMVLRGKFLLFRFEGVLAVYGLLRRYLRIGGAHDIREYVEVQVDSVSRL